MTHIGARINTLLLLLVVAMAAAIIGMLASRAYGGPLDPTGAPGSTDGVRAPGTPISSLPFPITQPGRYYLTRNLLLASNATPAITITADNVVLDLGGFTLDGNALGSSVAISDGGATHTNVSIEHGVVRGFTAGIFLGTITYGHIRDIAVIGGGTSILTQQKGLIEDCEVTGSIDGVNLAPQAIMRRCHIHNTTGVGVSAYAYSLVEDSVFELNNAGVVALGTRVTIRNNRFMNNAGGVSDVIVGSGTAAVVDNVINCATSVQAQGGIVVTDDTSGAPSDPHGHHNIPLYAAAFCGAP